MPPKGGFLLTMSTKSTTFENFAREYDLQMGSEGDYCHKNLIDPILFKCARRIEGKRIYDIGCGNGYLDKILISKQAKSILASDISESLIEIANQKHSHPDISYIVRLGDDFTDINVSEFDLVLLNMVIHYIPDLNQFASNISRVLDQGGRLAFTTSHPMNLMRLHRVNSVLSEDPQLTKLEERVESYLSEQVTQVSWGSWKELTVYQRPISSYIKAFTQSGLVLDSFYESPTEYPLADGTVFRSNVPMFMGFGFQKLFN
ncbi:MAG: hypothetical protein OHK0017_02080 [Patescibacteria group bacterium]